MTDEAVDSSVSKEPGALCFRWTGSTWEAPSADLPAPLCEPLQAALQVGAEEGDLQQLVIDRLGVAGLRALYLTLQSLGARRELAYRLSLLSLEVEHRVGAPPLAIAELAPSTVVRLRNDAFLRPGPGGLVLEAARSPFRSRLGEPKLAVLVQALADPEGEVLAELSRFGFALGELEAACGLLVAAGHAEIAGGSAGPERVGWCFHDLLLHSRSRLGLHDEPFGAVYPMRGTSAPPPVFLRSEREAESTLPRLRETPSEAFCDVLERRRSVRRHGQVPISLEQLGGFLELSASASAVRPGTPYDVALRPSIGGGALHELELYIVARSVSGLAPGLYHYAPNLHDLQSIQADPEGLESLVRTSSSSTSIESPQVLIVLVARFERMFWKYAEMGYATILKDVGAALQTMSLVGTVLGLASCPVGAGNAETFARVTGLDPLEQGAVGEMLIGSL